MTASGGRDESGGGRAGTSRRSQAPAPTRAQANLPVLAVALVVLTAVTGVGLAVADGSFASADRDAAERRLAVSLSDRMIAETSPLTVRENVLRRSKVDALTATSLANQFPVAKNHDVVLTLDGNTLVGTGEPSTGTTIRRVVLVARATTDRFEPRFDDDATVTLPRRTERVDLEIAPGSGTAVRTVWAGGHVVLHDDDGLDGSYTVDVSRLETTRLSFVADGDLSRGDVVVTAHAFRTSKAVLGVTVDD